MKRWVHQERKEDVLGEWPGMLARQSSDEDHLDVRQKFRKKKKKIKK